jgi:hypothetical protein
MVFEPSPADGALGIQSREVLAILERARYRRALRGLSVRRHGAARCGAQFRRLQNVGPPISTRPGRTACRARAIGSNWWRSGAGRSAGGRRRVRDCLLRFDCCRPIYHRCAKISVPRIGWIPGPVRIHFVVSVLPESCAVHTVLELQFTTPLFHTTEKVTERPFACPITL